MSPRIQNRFAFIDKIGEVIISAQTPNWHARRVGSNDTEAISRRILNGH
jgi:hypothetical protein